MSKSTNNDEKTAFNERKTRIGRLDTPERVQKYIEKCVRLGHDATDNEHWKKQAEIAQMLLKIMEHKNFNTDLERRVAALERQLGKEHK